MPTSCTLHLDFHAPWVRASRMEGCFEMTIGRWLSMVIGH
jgi:hypothetical protein